MNTQPSCRLAQICAFLTLTMMLNACGGGSVSAPPPAQAASSPVQKPPAPQKNVNNTVPITVTNSRYGAVNTPYISIRICSPDKPGSCQTIDHILLDTGSVGLRIYASALDPSVTPKSIVDANGNELAECMQFAEGYMWGPLRSINLELADEAALNLAMQVVSDPDFGSIPDPCTGTGNMLDTAQSFSASGVLGIGLFNQDCGKYCAQTPGIYYACNTQGCTGITLNVTSQIQNPVTQFSTNNNGTIISLNGLTNSIPALSASGTLTFGVDTQANNASSNANTLTADSGNGYIVTEFAGKNYSDSYLDSGSNVIFFDPPDHTLPVCATAASYYCPAQTLSLSAVLTGTNNASVSVAFGAANALSLFQNYRGYSAYPDLTGGASSGATFDWGLPFFYGKTIYTVIEGNRSSKGTGPYFGW